MIKKWSDYRGVDMTKTHCLSGGFQGVAVSDGWPYGGVLLYLKKITF